MLLTAYHALSSIKIIELLCQRRLMTCPLPEQRGIIVEVPAPHQHVTNKIRRTSVF